MKENEKKGELLKGSRLNFINDQEFSYSVMPGVFCRQYPVQNYQNIKTNTITMGVKWEENQKGTKVKKSKSRINSVGNLKNAQGENSQATKFSQPAKFRRLRNFRSPYPFLLLLFSSDF